jgi:hypothetical protein
MDACKKMLAFVYSSTSCITKHLGLYSSMVLSAAARTVRGMGPDGPQPYRRRGSPLLAGRTVRARAKG